MKEIMHHRVKVPLSQNLSTYNLVTLEKIRRNLFLRFPKLWFTEITQNDVGEFFHINRTWDRFTIQIFKEKPRYLEIDFDLKTSFWIFILSLVTLGFSSRMVDASAHQLQNDILKRLRTLNLVEGKYRE